MHISQENKRVFLHSGMPIYVTFYCHGIDPFPYAIKHPDFDPAKRLHKSISIIKAEADRVRERKNPRIFSLPPVRLPDTEGERRPPRDVADPFLEAWC